MCADGRTVRFAHGVVLLLTVEVIQSIMQVCCAGMAHCLDEAGSREM